MKALFTLLILILAAIYSEGKAQLSGTKTIPGDYSTIAAAVSDLNINGVGAGGVIFDVAAGHTETSSNIVITILANLPTASNTIVFQKSGTGVNPLITAAAGTSASLDGIIKINGADYITFDAIDLLDPPSNTGNAMMEWGYVLLRESIFNGSQHNVIRNCNVTLQKINTSSIGIYIAQINLAGTIINSVNSSGNNNYNKVYGNNISNVFRGIRVLSSTTITRRDSCNEIGVNGLAPNNFTNFAGGTTATDVINCQGQVNLKVNNNIINGGSGTNLIRGINISSSGDPANFEISYNNVTINSLGIIFGILVNTTADTLLLHHNTIENCNTTSTGQFKGISYSASDTTSLANINDNVIRNNTFNTTSQAYLIEVVIPGNVEVFQNQIYGNQISGSSGEIDCIKADNCDIDCYSNNVFDNSIPNSSGSTSSRVFGYYYGSGFFSDQRIFDNIFYNLSVTGSNTSTGSMISGINVANSSTLVQIYGNQIYQLSGICGSGTLGGVFGIRASVTSLDSYLGIFKNKIDNLTNNASNGITVGCLVTGGEEIAVFNNFISNLKAPISINSNAIIGISNLTSSTNSSINMYFNTIFLLASGGSTFGSSGIFVAGNTTSSTGHLNLINNIIINLSNPGSTSGVTAAYRRGIATLNNYSINSDYNDFYAGTPSPNRLIFFDGTNSDQTLTDFQTRVNPRESNSKSLNVFFADSPGGDLHLAGTSIGDPDLLGIPVSGITTDIDNDIRNASTPVIGADEAQGEINYNTVSGAVFRDDNQNNVKDEGEPPLSNITISLNSGASFASTDVNGNYLIHCGTGENTVSIPSPPLYYSSYPAMHAITFPDTGYGNVDTSNNFALGLNVNLMTGTVFRDLNENGNKDENEPPYPNIILSLNSGEAFTISDVNGNYIMLCGQGTQTVTIPYPPLHYSVTPASNTATFPIIDIGYIDSLNHFALSEDQVNDLRITLSPISPSRPGFDVSYRITYKNVGTITNSGTIELTYDSRYDFLYSIPVQETHNSNVLTWSYSNLTPAESRDITVGFNLPPIHPNNTRLTSVGKIFPVEGDVAPHDNVDSCSVLVVGSFDPNDKSVNSASMTPLQIADEDSLTYTIRFQNTGTDTAFTVVVVDTIGSKLNFPTFEMASASHSYSLTVSGSGIVKWTFNNILLPDSTTNEPASHGFIKYRIKPKDDMVIGDSITNTAHIFFDFNASVATNTTVTYIDYPDKIIDLSFRLEAMFPVQDTITVLMRNSSSPYNVIDSVKAVPIADTDYYTSFIPFENLSSEQSYYIVIKHRNSIETWSANPVSVFMDTTEYDFTASVSQAYGDNMTSAGGVPSIFGGDVNQDGYIDLGDITDVFNDASSFLTGYLITDVNGDNFVDLSDLTITFNNSSAFVSIIRP